MVKFKTFVLVHIFTIPTQNCEENNLWLVPINKKKFSWFLLVLLFILTFQFYPVTRGAIVNFSMIPESGSVGNEVNLYAELTSERGEYLVLFDESIVAQGTASDYQGQVDFIVPQAVQGNHSIIFIDEESGENISSVFTVTPSHSLEVPTLALPKQLQEGDSLVFNVTLHGGFPSTQYSANITVKSPDNASHGYLFSFTTSELGSANSSIVFPQHFSIGTNTNLTGEYLVSFNSTLATASFYIGLTDSVEYHRLQPVKIQASYPAGERVTLTISGGELWHSLNLTADSIGAISSVWVIPSTATVDTYTVTVFSLSNLTVKNPPDVQNFSVPGYPITFTTSDLSKEVVSQVRVQAYENELFITETESNPEGSAILQLEPGSYQINTYYKNESVGEWMNTYVSKNASYNLDCNLTSLRVIVTNEAGVPIPEIEISLSSENWAYYTDINGKVVIHALLPNHNYVLNASRYEYLFNTSTIHKLVIAPFFNVTLIVPIFTSKFQIQDLAGNPINNVVVRLQELMGGTIHEGETDNAGSVTLAGMLGSYTASVLYDDTVLNRTHIELTHNEETLIICNYYALDVNISVIDYFGTPISDLNVTLTPLDFTPQSSKTDSLGIASFDNMFGGVSQLTVCFSSQTTPCYSRTYLVDSTETIEVKLNNLVVINNFRIGLGELVTMITIVLGLTFFLVLEREKFFSIIREKTL